MNSDIKKIQFGVYIHGQPTPQLFNKLKSSQCKRPKHCTLRILSGTHVTNRGYKLVPA